MVVKVIGKANDFDLVFEREGGSDIWTTVLPSIPSGEYTVELSAEDAAGNISYTAKAIIVIDATKLCVHIIMQDYYAELVDTDLQVELHRDNICIEFVDDRMNPVIVNTDYRVEIIYPICKEKEGARID